MSNEKHSRYMKDPDIGHVELIPADEVEAKRAAGWVDPEGVRANGYVFNREEDQLTTDAAGDALAARNKYRADKAKKEADAAKDVDKAAAPKPVVSGDAQVNPAITPAPKADDPK
jgi:hypothetical protein